MVNTLAKLPVLRLVALACFLLAAASAFHAATPTMPLSKGDTWIYRGTVAWQEGTEVKTRQVTLATRVVETFSYPSTLVAVVRSFPSELAWYDDKRRPQYSLLVLTAAGLARMDSESDKEAHRLARDFPRLLQELGERKVTIVAFPLENGRRFRDSVKGVRPSRNLMVYESINRTNPDHTIVDFVPTLGVVRYVYEHHGTVSSVDVKLVEIRRRAASSRRRT